MRIQILKTGEVLTLPRAEAERLIRAGQAIEVRVQPKAETR